MLDGLLGAKYVVSFPHVASTSLDLHTSKQNDSEEDFSGIAGMDDNILIAEGFIRAKSAQQKMAA